MTFRTKLMVIFSVAVVVAVGLVSWTVSATTRQAFEQLDDQRTQALVAQFRREFTVRSQEVSRRVEGVAQAEVTLRMAIEAGRPEPDYSAYVNEARGLAEAQGLDFLEFVAPDGKIISSAHWPARFGYQEDWITQAVDWRAEGAFLKREELPEEVALALVAVRTAKARDKVLYVAGGQRLDKEFLASLVLPAGMRALLYRTLEPAFSARSLVDVSAAVEQPEKLAPVVERARREGREVAETIQWTSDAGSAETFHAIPLSGRDRDLLGVLLVGSSRRELARLAGFIRRMAVGVGAAGVVLGVILSWWATSHVTRPVRLLADGARAVAAGNWNTSVHVASRDEIGELARAFNKMTEQLLGQRDRLIQTERVAAWRELARRLAHELKNPLFPLQITIENMQRARAEHPEQFDEVFRESTATLLAELVNLKTIIGRFSDFARMPPPQLEPVNVNEIARRVLRLFDAQLAAPGRSPIQTRVLLDEDLPSIEADPEQLQRALQNLVLNAMDAMPDGGTLAIRTAAHNGSVRLEVSDSGVGLTQEECARLFTPYYTSKQHGTGLGLAIVQSVVSDHGARISVESEPGRGTTFRIDFQAS